MIVVVLFVLVVVLPQGECRPWGEAEGEKSGKSKKNITLKIV